MEFLLACMWVIIIFSVPTILLLTIIYAAYVFIRSNLEVKYPGLQRLPDFDSTGLYWLPDPEAEKLNHTRCESCGHISVELTCSKCGGHVHQYFGDKKLIDVRKERGLQ